MRFSETVRSYFTTAAGRQILVELIGFWYSSSPSIVFLLIEPLLGSLDYAITSAMLWCWVQHMIFSKRKTVAIVLRLKSTAPMTTIAIQHRQAFVQMLPFWSPLCSPIALLGYSASRYSSCFSHQSDSTSLRAQNPLQVKRPDGDRGSMLFL